MVSPLAGLGAAWVVNDLIGSEIAWFVAPLLGLTVFQLLLALETKLAAVSKVDVQRASSGQSRG